MRNATAYDFGAVPEAEFGETSTETRPYQLDMSQIAAIDNLVRKAIFYPEEALAEILLRFGDDRSRAPVVARLKELTR